MKQQLSQGAVCLAVAAGLALAACDVKVGDGGGMSFDITQGRAEDEWKRTYTLATGGQLEIISGGGPVNVTPSTGPAVEIRITREARASNDEAAQQALKEETITEEATPERVKIQTMRLRRDNSGPLGRRRISTTFVVAIPAGLNVSITGENADVSLTNVQGTFTLQNTNGGLRAEGLLGSISATTVNGIINLEFAEVAGDVKATTVNGPVRVVLPETSKAALEAGTVNGQVSVDEALVFTPTVRERARVVGDINGGGGPKIVLQTTNGSVRVGTVERPRGRRDEPVVLERQLQER
jgi:DUF4097 and DUF4098 domain-containing protein YvlB